MKFSALPVRVGDSFLLRHDGRVILVDGGKHKLHITELLASEQIENNHIDLLVCTHYDADHINGIIGILQSEKYTFTELWLPEILGSLGYTLSIRIREIFDSLRQGEIQFDNFDHSEESIFGEYEDKKVVDISSDNDSVASIDCDVLRVLDSSYLLFEYEYIFLSKLSGETASLKMMLAAKAIANLIRSSLDSGAYVRWFKYAGKEVQETSGFDLYSENGIQVDITLFDRAMFFRALAFVSLSRINKYSLVYMYKMADGVDVLFTSDSDLSFYSRNVSLRSGSIVTSPHHGSKANDMAYNNINGSNLIFVRSDNSQTKRPGRGYLNNKNRYCTICRNITPKKKVELNYIGSKFCTSAIPCKC